MNMITFLEINNTFKAKSIVVLRDIIWNLFMGPFEKIGHEFFHL